jgi:hypothetical protein
LEQKPYCVMQFLFVRCRCFCDICKIWEHFLVLSL